MNNELSQAESTALETALNTWGRAWKERLRAAWLTGHYDRIPGDEAATLQRLRNTRGPRWLSRFSFTK